MKIVVIEDEQLIAEDLIDILKIISPDCEIVAHLSSVREGNDFFSGNYQVDLIFSDIQLGDGLSFELFKNFQPNIPVIFCTAYDEYALRAFKLNSIDYLLKPIDEDDLETAVTKFKNQFQKSLVTGLDFEAIKKMLVNPIDRQYKKRFTIKMGQQLKMIAIDEVECFFSENKGTYLHTVDNRDYLLDSTLEQLETELDPDVFYRVSRKFIIPMKAIKEIQLYSNSRLKVILPTYKDDEVIVARERVNDFKEWLG